MGAHARSGGVHFLWLVCVCVCPSGCRKTAGGPLKKGFSVHRGESRIELRGLKLGGEAMRGAVPCLSADLTPHAVKTLYPAGFENGEAVRAATG